MVEIDAVKRQIKAFSSISGILFDSEIFGSLLRIVSIANSLNMQYTQTKQTKITREIYFLRISYWVAAIADFGIAILVLMPERMGTTEIVYPMGLTSAIAFSWGVLLLFADRQPVERKWVLIPTIIVVLLLTMVRAAFPAHDQVAFKIAVIVFGIVLVSFMTFSYYSAIKNKSNKPGQI